MMRSISHKKTIVTALAAGSLAVLGTAGTANAASNPTPPTSTSSVATAPAHSSTSGTGTGHSGQARSDTVGSPMPGDNSDAKTGVDRPEASGDQADSGHDRAEGIQTKGQDTDHVQQRDQHGPDVTGGSSARMLEGGLTAGSG